jgi:hypothetical protein
MAETSKGLPVVEASTVEALWQNYTTRESWGGHLEDVKQRLLDENPELVGFVESQVGRFPSELHTPVFEMIVGAIAVLESQAEANKLADQFGSEPQQ